MDFLQAHDRVSGLLPTATRLAQLQTACERLQPTVFASCRVVHVSDGLLQVAVPNAALATRLRQQLPKLAASLREKGWPVEEVRLKVQVMAERLPPPPVPKKRELPSGALQSFAELANSLDTDPRNEGLRDALQSLLQRRQA
jgi:hypothetical protein